MAQENISSYPAWSQKVGAWSLLYSAQVSRHLMPSVEMVSKRTLDLTGLEICKVWNIWDLKDENQRYSVSWKVIEKTQSFNPITLQCKLCLSEIVNILLNPTDASLNKRSETYGFCRHRKKYLLAHSKPLALKGGALTYRYKRWKKSHFVKEYHFLCHNSM